MVRKLIAMTMMIMVFVVWMTVMIMSMIREMANIMII